METEQDLDSILRGALWAPTVDERFNYALAALRHPQKRIAVSGSPESFERAEKAGERVPRMPVDETQLERALQLALEEVAAGLDPASVTRIETLQPELLLD